MRRLPDDLFDQPVWTAPPHLGTAAARRFYRRHVDDLIYLTLEVQTVETHERFITAVAEVLSKGTDRDPRQVLEGWFSRLDRLKQTLERTQIIRGEIGLVRSVENLLVYLSELLHEIFIQKPEMLRSQEHVALEEVLRHKTLDDFVQWAADRRVTDLSFRGWGDLDRYFKDRLKLPIVTDNRLGEWFGEAVATRNLFVHRRGYVDERYLKVAADSGMRHGDRVEVSAAEGFHAIAAAALIVNDLDGRAASKFQLSKVETGVDNEWQEATVESMAAQKEAESSDRAAND